MLRLWFGIIFLFMFTSGSFANIVLICKASEVFPNDEKKNSVDISNLDIRIGIKISTETITLFSYAGEVLSEFKIQGFLAADGGGGTYDVGDAGQFALIPAIAIKLPPGSVYKVPLNFVNVASNASGVWTLWGCLPPNKGTNPEAEPSRK